MNSKLFNFTLKALGLYVFWLVLCGGLDKRSVITGLGAVLFVMLISNMSLKRYASRHVFIQYHYHIVWFLWILLIEIFRAAYQHIQRVFSGEDQSVIFEIELSVTDEFAIALIANAITLTPGTLTMQVHDQRLTILGFAESDREIEDIRRTIIDKFQKPFLGRDDACSS